MSTPRPVPWRTIWATIGSVLLTVVVVAVVLAMARVLVWVVIAAFLAVALNPAVDLSVRRLHLRRGAATTLVVLVGLVVLAGLVFLFVRPLVDQGSRVAEDLPTYVDEARRGKGPVGELIARYGLDEQVRRQTEGLQNDIGRLGTQSVAVLGTIGSALVATLTVGVLTFMILLEGDRLLAGVLALVPGRHRDHVSRVAQDCARAVTGYVTGNLVISVIAGASSFVMLLATGTPFAGVLALWVGVTDLIPLVGALLGAVVVVLVAFLVSPTVGIIAIVFFVVYQQVENHLLQPAVQSRTVRLNPLTVLVSALAGVELAGLLGALLAIPVAGVVTVILRDIDAGMRDEMRGVTVGADEHPADEVSEPEGFVDRDPADDRVVSARTRADNISSTDAGPDPGERVADSHADRGVDGA